MSESEKSCETELETVRRTVEKHKKLTGNIRVEEAMGGRHEGV